MRIDTFDGIVVGSGGAGGYEAPQGDAKRHKINTGKGRVIKHCWWTALDNIGDMQKFPHIEVNPAEDDDVELRVSGNGQPGLFRLRVHLVLGKPIKIV